MRCDLLIAFHALLHPGLQIAAMESEVQAKQQELIQLQAENEKLKSRARVLEIAERCSSEIHELMQLLDGLQVGGSCYAEWLQPGCSSKHCTRLLLCGTCHSADNRRRCCPGCQPVTARQKHATGVGWVQDVEWIRRRQ